MTDEARRFGNYDQAGEVPGKPDSESDDVDYSPYVAIGYLVLRE